MVVKNGLSYPSSNSRRKLFAFHITLIPLEKI